MIVEKRTYRTKIITFCAIFALFDVIDAAEDGWVLRYDLPAKHYYTAEGLSEIIEEIGGQICPPRLISYYQSTVPHSDEEYMRQVYSESQTSVQFCEIGFLREKENRRQEAIFSYKEAINLKIDDPSIIALAQTNLASLYLQDLNLQKLGKKHAHVLENEEFAEKVALAYDLYKRAAESGYAPAQAILGNLYMCGFCRPKNYPEGLKFLRQAEIQGYPVALNTLGTSYFTGIGVDKNYNMAVEYYQRAAALEYPNSMAALAGLYESGLHEILKKDENRSIYLYEEAARLGSLQAKLHLAHQYEAVDNNRALDLLKECCDKNYAPAQFLLSTWYFSGRGGIVIDVEKAGSLLLEAAQNGLLSAGNLYGKLLLATLTEWKNITSVAKTNSTITTAKTFGEGYITDTHLSLAETRNASITSLEIAAVCYQFGLCGKLPNLDKAIEFYARAGRKTVIKHIKAFKLFKQGNEEGYAPSTYSLAKMYEEGYGVIKDENEMANLLEEAANQGLQIAKLDYAKCLVLGKGRKENILEALRWLASAAKDQDPELVPPLYVATINNDADSIERIVAADQKAKSTNFFNITALHLSSFCGHLSATKKLLEIGLDVHAIVGDKKVTPLHCALVKGNDFIVEILSERERPQNLLLSIYDLATSIPNSMLLALTYHPHGDFLFREEIGYWDSSSTRLRGSNLLFRLLQSVSSSSTEPQLSEEMSLIIRSGMVSLNQIIAENSREKKYFLTFCNKIIESQQQRFGSITVPTSRFLEDVNRDVEIQLQQSERRLAQIAPATSSSENRALASIESRMRQIFVDIQRGIDERKGAIEELDFASSIGYLKGVNDSLKNTASELVEHITTRMKIYESIDQEFSFFQQSLFVSMFENIVGFYKLNSPRDFETSNIPRSALGEMEDLLNDVYRREGFLLLFSNIENNSKFLQRTLRKYLHEPLSKKEDLDYFIQHTFCLIKEMRNWCYYDFLIANKKSTDCIIQFKIDPVPIDSSLLKKGEDMLKLVKLKSDIYIEVENLKKEYEVFFKKFYKFKTN